MKQEYVFVFLYFIVLIGIGIYSFFKARSAKDFYAAGKKGTVPWVAGSLLATILGGSAVIGAVNWSFNYGWAVAWFLLCGALGLACLLPVTKYVTRYGKYTLPELLGDFYGKEVKLIASIIIPIAWIGIIGAQFNAASKITAGFFDFPFETGVIAAGIIFILYTILGGQISILKTDLFQSIFIITGVIVVFTVLLSDYRGNLADLTPLSFPFNKAFGVRSLIVLVITYASTYFVGPDIYSRLFCAKDEWTAKRSIFLTILILVPLSFVLAFIGVYSSRFLNVNPGQQSALVTLVVDLHTRLPHLLPAWLMGVVIAALFSVVMSSADTTLLTASTILSEVFIDPEDAKSVVVTRGLIGVIGILGMCFALFLEKSIIDSLLYGLTLFSASFMLPTAAGLLGYRVKKEFVITAVVAGCIIALAGKLINQGVIQLANGRQAGEMIIIAAFIVNAVILFFPLLLRLLKKKKEQEAA